MNIMKLSVAGVLIALSLPMVAAAQNSAAPIRTMPLRYEPSRPTLSPAMNYFRRDTGLVGPYQAFIQPQLRRSTLAQQQNSRFGNLSQTVRRQGQQAIRPTGISAGFLNYSHYYQVRSQTRRR